MGCLLFVYERRQLSAGLTQFGLSVTDPLTQIDDSLNLSGVAALAVCDALELFIDT